MIGESIKITEQKFRLSDKQDLCTPISPLSLNANLRKLLQSRSMRRESIQTGINYNALCKIKKKNEDNKHLSIGALAMKTHYH